MSILDLLLDHDKWNEFLDYKIEKSHLSKAEEQNLISYVNDKQYLPIAKQVVDGTYTFSVPSKVLLNKTGTNKKRVIYTFEYAENTILKFVLFCMAKYDQTFSSNCFSFRKNLTIKNAIFSLLSNKDIYNMYAYKLDISNYFNSIPVHKLLPILEKVLVDDSRLYEFIRDIITSEKAILDGVEITEKQGVMAGTPLSTFLANIYLTDLDKYFEKKNVIYARYSDDIIVFAPDLVTLSEYKRYILTTLSDKGLAVNPEKEFVFKPHEPWNFLGFEFCDGTIDLSNITLNKIKAKIRRKARALYRWKIRKSKTTEHTIKVMLRVFNTKFYKRDNVKDFTWCKWFFPVITTHTRLEIIDNYLVQYLRYLSTGRFSKSNYKITYDYLKVLGFRSLVNEYYKFSK